MPTRAAVVEFEEVRKAFGDTVVLDGVSFQIPAGETTAIMGPSGAGKSVILKHIVGLLQPDSGHVRVLGTDMATATHAELFAVRKRFGMLFQDAALFDSLTVAENITFPLDHHAPDMTEAQKRERVAETLEMVELPGFEGRATADLSGGQRKRIGLARAIVMKPEIVLFDEPNSGLDPVTSDAIDNLIVEMKAQLGITFIVISHDIVGTVRVADHIGMLYEGQLVEYAPTAEVLRSKHPVVRRFLQRNLDLSDPEQVRLPRS